MEGYHSPSKKRMDLLGDFRKARKDARNTHRKSYLENEKWNAQAMLLGWLPASRKIDAVTWLCILGCHLADSPELCRWPQAWKSVSL